MATLVNSGSPSTTSLANRRRRGSRYGTARRRRDRDERRNGSIESTPRYGFTVTAWRLVALERLGGVLLGGRADVAALGVENHDDIGIGRADVATELDQLIFRPSGREVGDLRFERADLIGGRIDDRRGRTQPIREGSAAHVTGQLGRIGIEADAQHRAAGRPRVLQPLGKADHRRSAGVCHQAILLDGRRRTDVAQIR